MSTHSLQKLLKHSRLQNITIKARSLEKLNHVLLQLLPPDYKMHCRVMNLKQGILSVEVDSATYMTRLRYEQDSLLAGLQSKLPKIAIHRLQFKVRPTKNNQEQCDNKVDHPSISKESQQLLRDTAHSINNNPALKAALLKLSRSNSK